MNETATHFSFCPRVFPHASRAALVVLCGIVLYMPIKFRSVESGLIQIRPVSAGGLAASQAGVAGADIVERCLEGTGALFLTLFQRGTYPPRGYLLT